MGTAKITRTDLYRIYIAVDSSKETPIPGLEPKLRAMLDDPLTLMEGPVYLSLENHEFNRAYSELLGYVVRFRANARDKTRSQDERDAWAAKADVWYTTSEAIRYA